MATTDLGFTPNLGGAGYKFDPARAFRWELVVQNFGNWDKIRLALKTCDRPTAAQDPVTIEHFNDRFYIAGKTTFSELKCTAYDTIPDSPVGLYVSQMLQEWKHLIFDPATNIMLPGSVYKKDAILTMYDGAGIEQFSYQLYGIWPINIAPSSLDYGSSEAATVDITFKIDKSWIIGT